MAVGVVLEFDGATLDQYEEIIKKMGLKPKGKTPPGALFHWVAKTDAGMLVTDVWETKEHFEKYSQEKIGPFSAEVGITAPPKVTFYEVHNYLTAG